MAGDTSGGDDLEQSMEREIDSPDLGEPGPASTFAGRDAPRWRRFVVIAATIALLDQATKAWLVGRLGPGESMSVVGDTIRLVHGQNSGALFGLFRDQALLFAAASLGVIALIVVYHARAGRSGYVSLTLGLLLGGAIGNLIDRLRLGHVVDFVDVGLGDVRFYTFNVADSAVSVAILLLIIAAVMPARVGLGDRFADG